ncbi:hypothetical protein ILYODFUR_019998 [Ilyodon furcidens]|uniref:Uncharacterized protein n=1 Tax=Ilyodon furcidens TaxID=33524 RepID=A0ABV0V681_9TELE
MMQLHLQILRGVSQLALHLESEISFYSSLHASPQLDAVVITIFHCEDDLFRVMCSVTFSLYVVFAYNKKVAFYVSSGRAPIYVYLLCPLYDLWKRLYWGFILLAFNVGLSFCHFSTKARFAAQLIVVLLAILPT